MSFGLPCFGTSIAGIPELIPTNKLISKNRIVQDICTKLSNLNINDLVESATRNIYEAQKYEFDCLNERREMFFRTAIEQYLSKT